MVPLNTEMLKDVVAEVDVVDREVLTVELQ